MRYINTKTGAVIDSPCAVSGGNWALVEEPKQEVEPEQDKKPKPDAKKKG